MRIKYIFFFLILNSFLFSQDQKQIDSVKKLIPQLNSDTARIRNYLVLAEWIADLDEWSAYNNKALELIAQNYDKVSEQSTKDRLKLFRANALNNKGLFYREKGDFTEALKTYNESLKLQRELKNIEGEAVCLVNISAIEISNGNAMAGITKNLEALKIFRDVLHDKIKTATVLSNIGHEYMGQGDTKQAIDFYNQALELQKEMKNEGGQALVYTNFGNLYFGVNEYKLSLDYYKKAAEIYIRIGDRRRTAKVYTNISSDINIIEKKPSYKYDSLALEIFSKLDDQEGMSRCYHAIGVRLKKYGNVELGKTLIARALNIRLKLGETIDRQISALHLADAYLKTGHLDSALYWARKSDEMANITGYNTLKADAALSMSNVYTAKKDFATALKYYKIYKSLSDSAFNDESRNAIHKQLSKMEMNKREAELRTEQEKHELIVQAELKRQQILRNAFLLGFAAVSVLLFFVFKNYKEKKKANQEIIAQKHLVEEKQKEILDSINYAKRIQEAILPDKAVKYKLFPNAFVLFQPKDIVSGDFYWFMEKNGKRLIAAVDCTGHGVPGAFMSLIGNTFLNEIVNVRGITSPGKILDLLREQIIHSLKQSGGENKDGMDISILSFDDQKNELEYAGANNPLWIVRNGVCEEVKATKQPVGYFGAEAVSYVNNVIPFKKGDTFYIFTDGFADQFGGDNGKKFKYKNLKDALLAIQNKSMADQETELIEIFTKWKGGLEQIDDVCVIGVRI